jgi:hypothetical protein
MLSDADRLLAHELYARYAYAFDSNAAAEWAALFTEDGAFRLGAELEIRGREALREFAAGRNESAPGVSHHTTNVLVEETAAEALRGRAYVLALRVDGPQVRIRNLGAYVDELVKVDGAWLYRERHFTSWLDPGTVDAALQLVA